MCIVTARDAQALQELADEMVRVTGAYPAMIPQRKFFFGGSRFTESEKYSCDRTIILKIPLSCHEQEEEFLKGFFSIQDGEIGIETIT